MSTASSSKGLKNDLPSFNGDDSWTLPMPARFVIGQDGVIRYAEVNPDYTRRPEPLDMLPTVRAAAASPPDPMRSRAHDCARGCSYRRR